MLIPVQSYGANGSQLAGFTKYAPTRITNTTAPSLIATITAFALALSLMPFTRIAVRRKTTSTAGRLTNDPVETNCSVTLSNLSGADWNPAGTSNLKRILSTSWKYPD